MKKLIILCAVCTVMLFANEDYELKLYEKILPDIFAQTPIYIYATHEAKEILQKSTKFKVVDRCDKRVVLLVGEDFTHLPVECKNKPVFATNYRTFRDNANSFGAFYWSKGRPQVYFKQKNVQKFHIKLPSYLRKYER